MSFFARVTQPLEPLDRAVNWLVAVGAWDRRAEQLRRRPWQRLSR